MHPQYQNKKQMQNKKNICDSYHVKMVSFSNVYRLLEIEIKKDQQAKR